MAKIALSRVYLKEADCYLLDEPSSALDPESETKILKHFLNYRKIKLVFLLRISQALLNL